MKLVTCLSCHAVVIPLLAVVALKPGSAVSQDAASAALTDGVALTEAQSDACVEVGLDPTVIARLVDKPLYEFTESEVDSYLRFLHATEPDLRRRMVQLARKNIGQPYEIFLLGEMPFEHHDPQPLYCLQKSDCLVFSEHTYAMALAPNWPSFMAMLQRIRYRDGQIGVRTRNHFTEADWNESNRWLVQDVTRELAGDAAVEFEQRIDRAAFFKSRYALEVDVPVQQHRDVYLPLEVVERAKPQLHDGDFVNVIRGVVRENTPANPVFGGHAWVGHVGLVVHGDDGAVHLIHSAKPQVREEPIDDYIAASLHDAAARDAEGKPRLLGFKFLRLTDQPLSNLREIDGADAPRVTLPTGGGEGRVQNEK